MSNSGVWGSNFGFEVTDFECQNPGFWIRAGRLGVRSGSNVAGSGCVSRVWVYVSRVGLNGSEFALGLRVQGSGFRVQGSGFRVMV